jgi:hypothetical protein
MLLTSASFRLKYLCYEVQTLKYHCLDILVPEARTREQHAGRAVVLKYLTVDIVVATVKYCRTCSGRAVLQCCGTTRVRYSST